jgi:hypothetical protein
MCREIAKGVSCVEVPTVHGFVEVPEICFFNEADDLFLLPLLKI